MLTLPERLTHADVPVLLDRWTADLARLGSAGGCTVDASALTQFDSSALALLLHLNRRCLAGGARLVIQGPPPKLSELAALYGVADWLAA